MAEVVSVVDFEVLRYFVYGFALISMGMQVYLAYLYSKVLNILNSNPSLPR